TSISDSELASIKESLWRNNRRPSNAQRKAIETIIAEETAIVAQITADVADLQLMLNQILENMKAQIATRSGKELRIEQFKSLVAPIRMLPPEILQRILEYATSNLGLDPLSSLPHSSFPALETLSIRVTVEQTPPLSGALPHRLPPTPRTPIPKSLFGTLRRRFSGIPADIPPFRSETTLPPQSFLKIKRFVALSGASRIQSVTLKIPSSILETDLFPFLPWKKLTELNIENHITLESFDTIMFECLALCSASFFVELHHLSRVNSDRTPVTFHNLSALKLCISFASSAQPDLNSWKDVSKVMSNIKLSALKSLNLVAHSSKVAPPLCDLFQSKSHNLETLSSLELWHIFIYDPMELGELLGSCPNLDSFTLSLDKASGIDPVAVIVLHTCADQPFTRLRKFALWFVVLTASDVEAIVSSYAHLLETWTSADAICAPRMEGLDLRLNLCHEDTPRDLDKMHAAMNELRDKYVCVGGDRYRVESNDNAEYSEFSFRGNFVNRKGGK
ncbi:hypothetical protein H0H81_005271, partial [Sphagnurus paluster]